VQALNYINYIGDALSRSVILREEIKKPFGTNTKTLAESAC